MINQYKLKERESRLYVLLYVALDSRCTTPLNNITCNDEFHSSFLIFRYRNFCTVSEVQPETTVEKVHNDFPR